MPVGISAIAFSAPIIASNAIFASRRLNKGNNEIASDPVYGVLNYDIAAGQTLKGVKAIENLSAKESIEGVSKVVDDTAKAAEGASKAVKFGKGFMKVINFFADNINPIIYASGVWKTLNSDDKVNTGIEQLSAIGTMRLGEIGYCKLAAMPYYKRNKETGVLEKKFRKSPLFTEAQAKALEDTIATKKLFNKIPLKSVAHTAKGLGFVGTSIAFYTLGEKIGKAITGKRKESKADAPKTMNVDFNHNSGKTAETEVSKAA